MSVIVILSHLFLFLIMFYVLYTQLYFFQRITCPNLPSVGYIDDVQFQRYLFFNYRYSVLNI